MKHLYIFIVLLTSFSFSDALAQQPIYMQLTEKEGLPDKEFYNVLEDDKGFIWLAADKGLYRYDGREFKLFTHPDQVGLSVFSLTKDVDDRIWYTNLANQVFYVKNGEVTLFLNLKKYFSGSLPRIFLHKNLLIFSTARSAIIIDKNTKEIYYQKSINDSRLFNSKAFIHNNNICFFDYEGNFLTIDQDFQFQQKSSKLNYKTARRINVYIDTIDGKYIFIKRHLNGVNEYILFDIDDNNTIEIFASEFKNNGLINEVKVIDNNLYVSSNNGVFAYKIHNNSFIENEHLLPNVSVSDVLKDGNGNLWIATLFEGIYVVPNLKLNSNFTVPYQNTIRKIYKGTSDELFLIGKQKEFYVFNHTTKTTTTYVKDDVDDIKYVFYNDFTSLYYLQTTNALESLTIENNTFNYQEKYYPGIVKDHDIINKDSVLLASGASYALTNMKREPTNPTITRFYNENTRSYSCYYHKKNKHSYFGTVKGLFALDKHLQKREILYQNTSIFIKDIVASNDGSLWCLSFKNGIYQIKDNQVVKHLTVADGLLSNLNDFIRCDTKNNFLWIAGEKGLQQFNINTGAFQNLTKKQGIPSYEFTGLEMIDENVYVSTLKQLFSFHSKTVFSARAISKPIPYIASVTIDDEVQPTQTSYTLPATNERIEIAFNTNGFLSKETITYEYRLLENTTKNVPWQRETSQRNTILYNKLSQGTYTFQLRAKNGGQTSDVIAITLLVEGVFYQQWWFYLLGTLLISFLLWYYFHTKNKRFKEKQQLLLDKQSKELENVFLKLESLRSQMNPHFIFNALNSIQDYIIRNEKKLARTYLVKFSRLIRLYLEHSQKDEISLEEELIALNLYLELEKDRFEDSFQYKITVDETLEQETVFMPTFLLQPYVENAIKHGLLHKKNHRELAIYITKDTANQAMICTIDDNGIGRKASNIINTKKAFYPKSFSSDANEKRIELLNTTRKKPIILQIEDKVDAAQQPLGTKVSIKIPFADDTYDSL